MPQRILALETPGDLVRGALAERTWNSLNLTGVFEEQRRHDEAGLSEALKRLLARTGAPDVVISALPGEFVVKRLLELPFNDLRRLNQVVPFALEEHLPFPVDDAVVAFSRVGRDNGNTLVVAALARKPDLRNHLELLASAGLDPRTVTLSELAIAALMASRRTPTAQAPHLLLSIEPNSTSIVLVDSDGKPRALRTVQAGPASPGESLGRAAAATILSAARQTLMAHSTEVQHPDIVLAGSGAAIEDLRRQIAEGLAASVRNAAEFSGSSLLNGKSLDKSRFAGCAAMLLAESPAVKAELLDFRRDEFAFRGRIRGDLTPFYTTAMLAVAVVLVALLDFAVGVSVDLARLHKLDRTIAVAAAPALGPDARGNAVETLRSSIAKMNKRLGLAGAGFETSPLDALLALSRDLPRTFPVEMQNVTIDASGMKLSGKADSFATVDQMKKALSRDRIFGTVEVIHAKASSGGKVSFQLNLTFRDAEAG